MAIPYNKPTRPNPGMNQATTEKTVTPTYNSALKNGKQDFSAWDKNDFYEMYHAKKANEEDINNPNYGANVALADEKRKKYGLGDDTFTSDDMYEWDLRNRAYGENDYSRGANSILDKYKGLYKEKTVPSSKADVDRAYRDIENFRYNPEEDINYLAYRDKYLAESQQAQDKTYANLSAFTGGRNNSYASSAVAQVGQSYAQRIADMIPTLAEQAYNRLQQRYNLARDRYNEDVSTQDNEFNRDLKLYELYRGQDEDYRRRAESELDRRDSDRFNELDITQAELNNAYQVIANRAAQLNLDLDEKYAEPERVADLVARELQNNGLDINNQQAMLYLAKYPNILDEAVEEARLNNALTVEQIMAQKIQNSYMAQGYKI